MSDFLAAVKADLTDRRLLPIVGFVAVALIAAVGYAVVGGGSSSPSTPTASAGPVGSASPGITVSHVSAEKAVAETTSGAPEQRRGLAHNPFTLLPAALRAQQAAASPGAVASASVTPSSTATSGSAGSSSSSGSSPSPSSSTPKSEPKPSAPAKPKTVYHVGVLFGLVPTPVPGEVTPPSQLTPFENLKLDTPLPSATQPLVVYRGVTSGGKSATFSIVGEAILHGSGACLPSAEQCQAIDLKPNEIEKLEALSSTGQTLVYELEVVTIISSSASSATVKSLLEPSKSGGSLLRKDGLVALPGLHFSSQAGVLVFSTRHSRRGHPAHRGH